MVSRREAHERIDMMMSTDQQIVAVAPVVVVLAPVLSTLQVPVHVQVDAYLWVSLQLPHPVMHHVHDPDHVLR